MTQNERLAILFDQINIPLISCNISLQRIKKLIDISQLIAGINYTF